MSRGLLRGLYFVLFSAPEPQNCEGNFTYSPCSASCGLGSKTGVFHITKPASHGGYCPYVENFTYEFSCFEQPCGM